MKSPVSFEQLDRLTSELLPERSVLSAMTMAACSTSNTYTNPGVIGLLAPQTYAGPIQTTTCVPSAMATY